jgi:Mg2+-importing ATPase
MAAASLFLPFLPMLPTQILLNNFLYDTSQVSVPGDNVDPALLHKPMRWQIAFIRQFMMIIVSFRQACVNGAGRYCYGHL